MTEKKKVSWADVVRGREMKDENDDFVREVSSWELVFIRANAHYLSSS